MEEIILIVTVILCGFIWHLTKTLINVGAALYQQIEEIKVSVIPFKSIEPEYLLGTILNIAVMKNILVQKYGEPSASD